MEVESCGRNRAYHVDKRDVDEYSCGEREDPGGGGPMDGSQHDTDTHACERQH